MDFDLTSQLIAVNNHFNQTVVLIFKLVQASPQEIIIRHCIPPKVCGTFYLVLLFDWHHTPSWLVGFFAGPAGALGHKLLLGDTPMKESLSRHVQSHKTVSEKVGLNGQNDYFYCIEM